MRRVVLSSLCCLCGTARSFVKARYSPDRSHMEKVAEKRLAWKWHHHHRMRPHARYSFDPASFNKTEYMGPAPSSEALNGTKGKEVLQRLQVLQERQATEQLNKQLLQDFSRSDRDSSEASPLRFDDDHMELLMETEAAFFHATAPSTDTSLPVAKERLEARLRALLAQLFTTTCEAEVGGDLSPHLLLESWAAMLRSVSSCIIGVEEEKQKRAGAGPIDEGAALGSFFCSMAKSILAFAPFQHNSSSSGEDAVAELRQLPTRALCNLLYIVTHSVTEATKERVGGTQNDGCSEGEKIAFQFCSTAQRLVAPVAGLVRQRLGEDEEGVFDGVTLHRLALAAVRSEDSSILLGVATRLICLLERLAAEAKVGLGLGQASSARASLQGLRKGNDDEFCVPQALKRPVVAECDLRYAMKAATALMSCQGEALSSPISPHRQKTMAVAVLQLLKYSPNYDIHLPSLIQFLAVAISSDDEELLVEEALLLLSRVARRMEVQSARHCVEACQFLCTVRPPSPAATTHQGAAMAHVQAALEGSTEVMKPSIIGDLLGILAFGAYRGRIRHTLWLWMLLQLPPEFESIDALAAIALRTRCFAKRLLSAKNLVPVSAVDRSLLDRAFLSLRADCQHEGEAWRHCARRAAEVGIVWDEQERPLFAKLIEQMR